MSKIEKYYVREVAKKVNKSHTNKSEKTSPTEDLTLARVWFIRC